MRELQATKLAYGFQQSPVGDLEALSLIGADWALWILPLISVSCTEGTNA